MNELNLPSVGMAGWYKMEALVLDDLGQEVSRRLLADWFPNLITDQGLDYLGTLGPSGQWGDYLKCCQVGTGNTAPANADTALATYLAGTLTVNALTTSVQGSAPYYAFTRKTFRFAAGTATGNIAEVGVGRTTATGQLFSRALVLDGGGNPTTITVLSNEVLDVTYEFRVYPPLTDTNGNITIASVNYAYTLRAANVTSVHTLFGGNGWGVGSGGTGQDSGAVVNIASPADQLARTGVLAAITTIPSGAISAAGSTTAIAYSTGTSQMDGVVTFGLNNGNDAGGIKSIVFQFHCGCYQIQFTPNIPKDATKQLTLTFRHSWTRAVIP